MVAFLKFLAAILLSGLVSKSLCQQCSLDNLNVGQVRSGKEIQGKPEWNVTVYNNCGCSRSSIVFSCQGFQTIEEIDPKTFGISADGRCPLINGSLLKPHGTVQFAYAWDPPFLLLPIEAQVRC